MDNIKREEPEKACKKIRKVRTRMVMMWVIDTAGTVSARRAEGCKPTQVCPDCVAFLGSAVPERPPCIVPAVARHRFGMPARQQAGRFCGMDCTMPGSKFESVQISKKFR